MSGDATIRLEHGSGGALSRDLVDELIFPRFRGANYRRLSDATVVEGITRPCFTTDSFVVDPPFFPGSDIGRLAVFGTCNDLAVSGARPVAISLGVILEEGFAVGDFERVLDSVAGACEEAGVGVVTGDTKVVPRGSGGGIYLNTAGLGEMTCAASLDPAGMEVGDRLILSGPIGSHGIAVLAAREGLPVGRTVVSDCANLFPACDRLYALGDHLKIMRDATRGGVAAVTNELVEDTELSFSIDEASTPVQGEVAAAAGTLGLSPLEIANEGVFLAVVSADRADEAIMLLREVAPCDSARIVGEVRKEPAGRVVLETRIGGRRLVDYPRGLLLPRIC